jgi:hypothetical protein
MPVCVYRKKKPTRFVSFFEESTQTVSWLVGYPTIGHWNIRFTAFPVNPKRW